MITGAEFLIYVKAKLNRLDTNAYADIRDEFIFLMAQDAIKFLVLQYDTGQTTKGTDQASLNNYLASITKTGSKDLADNAVDLPNDILKIKDMVVNVKVDSEEGFVSALEFTNHKISQKESNYFSESKAYEPTYRLIDNKIKFITKKILDESANFICTKIKYEYLEQPEMFNSSSQIELPFIQELEDRTVTLILENLEQQRLGSQPQVTQI
jgi:hypothetical protein